MRRSYHRECFFSFSLRRIVHSQSHHLRIIQTTQTPHATGRPWRTRHRHRRPQLGQIRVYRRPLDQPDRERGLELRNVLHGEEGAENQGTEGEFAAICATFLQWLTKTPSNSCLSMLRRRATMRDSF